MSQQAKRVAWAFGRGAGAAFTFFIIEHYADFTKAVQVRDWASLQTLGEALIAGAIYAGFRAVQAYVKGVPSPEPEEN